MIFRYEKDMRSPVKAWLETLGYHVAIEFYAAHFPADIVAGHYTEQVQTHRVPTLNHTVAIELKLSDVATVKKQAVRNMSNCDASLCAMPADRVARMRPETISSFADDGIGLLSVSDRVEIVG